MLRSLSTRRSPVCASGRELGSSQEHTPKAIMTGGISATVRTRHRLDEELDTMIENTCYIETFKAGVW
jgi:hypothetical protein